MKEGKGFEIFKSIINWVLIAIAVLMMVFTIVSKIANKNNNSIFGLQMYIVMSDSMSKTDFSAGDLIFSVKVNPTDLKDGDIITFISQNEDSRDEVITHKIRTRTTDAEGNPGFVTYGTTTDTNDDVVVTYPYILGRYVMHIPFAGYFFNFIKTVPGYITCILVPFVILILLRIIASVRLFKQYKREQNAEIEEQKAQLEREREENRKILEELKAMRDQIESQKNN